MIAPLCKANRRSDLWIRGIHMGSTGEPPHFIIMREERHPKDYSGCQYRVVVGGSIGRAPKGPQSSSVQTASLME